MNSNTDRISDRIWVLSELLEYVPDHGKMPNYRDADDRLRSYSAQIDDRKRHVRELQQQIFELEHNKLEVEDRLADEITSHERHLLLSLKDRLRTNDEARKDAESTAKLQAGELERLSSLLHQHIQAKDDLHRNEQGLRETLAALQQQLREQEAAMVEKDKHAERLHAEVEALQRDTKAFRGTLLQFQQENQAFRERAVSDERAFRALQEENRSLQEEIKTMHNRYLVDDSTIRALQERSLYTANRVKELEETERAARVEAETLRKRAATDESDIHRLAEQERLLRLELDRTTERLRQSAEAALKDKHEAQRLRACEANHLELQQEVQVLREENRRLRAELDVPRMPFVGIELNEALGVVSVKEGGPAHVAGILEGDQIISFNGRAVHSREDFKHAVKTSEPGDVVAYVLLRGNYPRQQQMRGSVTVGGVSLAPAPPPAAAPRHPRSPSASNRA